MTSHRLPRQSLTASTVNVSCVGGADGKASVAISPLTDKNSTVNYSYSYDWEYIKSNDATAPTAGYTPLVVGAANASGAVIETTKPNVVTGPQGWYKLTVTNTTNSWNCQQVKYIYIDSYNIEASISHKNISSCLSTAATGQISVRPKGGKAPYKFRLKWCSQLFECGCYCYRCSRKQFGRIR